MNALGVFSTPPHILGSAYGYSLIAIAITASGNNIIRNSITNQDNNIACKTTFTGQASVTGNQTNIQVANAKADMAIVDATAAFNHYYQLHITLGAPPYMSSELSYEIAGGDIGGRRFTPGVYHITPAITIGAGLATTFDALGNPDAMFVVQVEGAFAPAAGCKVLLAGGAKASNIVWVVVGAFAAETTVALKGTFLSVAALTFAIGGQVEGRIISFFAAVTCAALQITTT
jgi:hypothetical protein